MNRQRHAILSYSVDDFCEANDISRAMFYNLVKSGKGPQLMKIGRRTLISVESAAAWRQRMESESIQDNSGR